MNTFMHIIVFCITIFSFSCQSSIKAINKAMNENSREFEARNNDDANALLWVNRYPQMFWTDPLLKEGRVEFTIISGDKKNEYVARLEHTQYIELDADEYYELTQKKQQKKYSLAIRAVYAQRGGQFRVLRNNNNEYLVHYVVLGSRVGQRNKEVLIIEADELPKEIFIEYSVVT
jgi:hypothetical protein